MGTAHRFNEISEQLADPEADYDTLLAEMGKLQEQLDHRQAWDLDAQLEQAMDALRCPPPDADVPCSPAVRSGGSRCASCCCRQPDLLLLDEPTNHLDAESVQWLEQHLEKYAGTVVAVTHDRYFLDNVAQWILELDRGRAYPVRGQLLDLPRDQGRAAEGRGAEGRQARKRLKDELEWVRSNAKAPPDQEQGPTERYEEMAAEADKTRKLDFEEIQIPPGPRLGSVVVETKDLTKGFGDRLLIDEPVASPCRATASSASSVRTASARPRCSR